MRNLTYLTQTPDHFSLYINHTDGKLETRQKDQLVDSLSFYKPDANLIITFHPSQKIAYSYNHSDGTLDLFYYDGEGAFEHWYQEKIPKLMNPKLELLNNGKILKLSEDCILALLADGSIE